MYRRMLVEEPQQLDSLFTDRFLSSNCDAPPRLSWYDASWYFYGISNLYERAEVESS